MLSKIIDKINSLQKSNAIVAIDGRCGAGKTTLATQLSEHMDCNVIHMDDFFLRPEQRTAERLNTSGGNVDHERFLREVLIPLSENTAFSYQPYSCRAQALGEAVYITPKPVTIIEGSYSCHPNLCDYYDLRIFADVSPDEQIKRITARNGDDVKMFIKKWIPLEEKYFAEFNVKGNSNIVV